ncbi:DNA polymerase family A-domain-containing protein [Kickxella alabastrina]|uniref:DNA polymerase family A-domain-containing protein n=1 Tax=Kickxella alabastrina TaxID=61397 RepID=UPI00222084FE|nr:DNA polymerase family A-domain-containing protein [Kickxella alabastrina]KAI7832034.1 DNA polymerase family A-domain-containing protein [Kickxella alabastrina]
MFFAAACGDSSTKAVDNSDFDLPDLQGETIEEHFMNIGEAVAKPYLGLASEFARVKDKKMPRLPENSEWIMQAGWTKYSADGSHTRVVVQDSPFPVMAAAASVSAWYFWVSPYLSGDSPHPRHLIPLMNPGQHQKQQPRLVIGHNIGYDRARIQEERLLKRPPIAFSTPCPCTSLRSTWIRYSRAKKDNDQEYLQLNADTEKFFDVSSLNSLREVAQHYCKITMDKSKRDVFVDGTIQDVRNDFAQLAGYCARDVDTTWRVYSKVFPAFRKKCPHPVSFAGMLTMIEGYLPVDRSWPEYVKRSEELLAKLSDAVSVKIRELAEEALKAESPMDDPWLKNLDWTAVPQKYTRAVYKVDGSYAKGGEPRPYTNQVLPGYPQWYRDLWDTKLKRIHITVRSRLAPYLLKLKWLGYPLYHSSAHGWTFRVPSADYHRSLEDKPSDTQLGQPNFKNMRKLSFPTDPEHADYESIPVADVDGVYFKVPHSDGPDANCGSPLAKGYQTAIEDGTLSSSYAMAKQAMDMNAMCSYWMSARERVKSQFVVPAKKDGEELGIILPMVVPMGTITRRAELWISALIGDSQFRTHGATAFGWMTLQGTKAAGTDLHSNSARILGIGRGSAKIFNYGRIYGAGVKYATTLLLRFNPDMTETEALEKANRLYASTKGNSMRNRKFFGRPFWHGGSESYMFNQLEAIATSDDPRTPVLGCAITDALKKSIAGSRFMTSRVNWVVQSSGVDYLHMLLVSMSYLARLYRIDMRFVISVHDEVRYMVAEHDVHRAALALQISNLWVRSLFSYRMGMEDLPQSVAFFSAVDVDHVLRKEVDMDCLTPTNTTPIPPGACYTISDTLRLTNGGRLDSPNSLVQTGRLPNSRIGRGGNATEGHSSTLPLTAIDEKNQPDSIWLTAQMLGSFPEIKKLIGAAERDAVVQNYWATSPEIKRNKSFGSCSETKRIVRKAKQKKM